MNLDKAILTVCEAGEDRSVAFATVLKHDYNYRNVLNCGMIRTTPQTFAMLAKWADIIYVTADRTVWRMIPPIFRGKAIFVNIGKDIWHSATDSRLKAICRKEAIKLGV